MLRLNHKIVNKFFVKIILIILFLIAAENIFGQRILWEESFDDFNIITRGWKIVNNDSSAFDPGFYNAFNFVNLGPQNPQDGNYFYKFGFDNANYRNLADDWLITPRFYDIQKGDSISFWCGAVDLNFPDSLKVWISVTDNNLSGFAVLDHFKVEGPVGSWHLKKYDLSSYAGKNIFLAVNYYLVNGGPLGTSSDNVWVDNFKLTGKGFGGVEPASFELHQNFPNPFNPSTQISFDVPFNSHVSIIIYDLLGKEILRLADGNFDKGKYSFDVNAANLASGVYFYKMTATGGQGDFTETKKMEVVK